jgi:hypothetical protein
MKSKVESLTQQVNDLRHENTQLKAQSTDVHTLKVKKSKYGDSINIEFIF